MDGWIELIKNVIKLKSDNFFFDFYFVFRLKLCISYVLVLRELGCKSIFQEFLIYYRFFGIQVSLVFVGDVLFRGFFIYVVLFCNLEFEISYLRLGDKGVRGDYRLQMGGGMELQVRIMRFVEGQTEGWRREEGLNGV